MLIFTDHSSCIPTSLRFCLLTSVNHTALLIIISSQIPHIIYCLDGTSLFLEPCHHSKLSQTHFFFPSSQDSKLSLFLFVKYVTEKWINLKNLLNDFLLQKVHRRRKN